MWPGAGVGAANRGVDLVVDGLHRDPRIGRVAGLECTAEEGAEVGDAEQIVGVAAAGIEVGAHLAVGLGVVAGPDLDRLPQRDLGLRMQSAKALGPQAGVSETVL